MLELEPEPELLPGVEDGAALLVLLEAVSTFPDKPVR